MKRLPAFTSSESGSALVAVTVVAFVMLLTAAAVFEFAARDAALASHGADRSRALYLAESGIAKAHTWLEAQNDPPAGLSAFSPFGAAPETLDYGTYTVSVIPDSNNPWRSRKYYRIRGTGSVGGQMRTVEREVMTQSFAQFIYFTEDEHLPGSITPVWFCSADYLNGALHTNGQMHIMGDPHFAGHVSSAYGGPDDPDPSADPSFMYYNGDYWNHLESPEPDNAPHDQPSFDQGYELGASGIELPEYLGDLQTLAQNGGIYVDGNVQIEFGRVFNGSRLWGYVSYSKKGIWHDVPISSFNGVFYVNGTVQIQGVLDGACTVGASGDIAITNDLVYRDADPVDGPNEGCDDLLGLVSESNVVIADTWANNTDCNVHAHIMALNTSFYVENYRDSGTRGTLTIHGGIIQRYRGAVGTGYLYNDQIVVQTGYAKNYQYDPRFERLQPPGYLMTGKYYNLRWREV